MRSRLTNLLAVALLVACTGHAAYGQGYPGHPMHLIIPFPTGGATDILGRVLAQKLGAELGQPFVIDNIPGSGGSLGAGNAARAAADGYTLLLGTSSLSVARALGAPLPYDVVRDFAPIIHLADAPRVLAVSAALPYRSMTELIAGARQRPGVLNYASSGIGTIPLLSAEEFKLLARVDITHVPYKGTTQAFADLAPGQIAMLLDSVVSVQASVRSGKVRILAVSSAQRSALMPDVPTFAEAGLPGFIENSYFGLFAPIATSAAIIEQINAAANRLLKRGELSEQLSRTGAVPVGGTPQALGLLVVQEATRWSGVIKAAGVTPE